jgi:hypothetical protein
MLFVHGSLSLVLFAFWVCCLIDVVTTEDAAFRTVGKAWWLVVVLLGLELGAVLWLVAGRPRSGPNAAQPLPVRLPALPESSEDFLRRCRERAEAQRRRYREQP